jgi:hypothetical protein
MNFSQDNQIFSPTEKQSSDFHTLFQIQAEAGVIEKGFYRKLKQYLKYIKWIP